MNLAGNDIEEFLQQNENFDIGLNDIDEFDVLQGVKNNQDAETEVNTNAETRVDTHAETEIATDIKDNTDVKNNVDAKTELKDGKNNQDAETEVNTYAETEVGTDVEDNVDVKDNADAKTKVNTIDEKRGTVNNNVEQTTANVYANNNVTNNGLLNLNSTNLEDYRLQEYRRKINENVRRYERNRDILLEQSRLLAEEELDKIDDEYHEKLKNNEEYQKSKKKCKTLAASIAALSAATILFPVIAIATAPVVGVLLGLLIKHCRKCSKIVNDAKRRFERKKQLLKLKEEYKNLNDQEIMSMNEYIEKYKPKKLNKEMSDIKSLKKESKSAATSINAKKIKKTIHAAKSKPRKQDLKKENKQQLKNDNLKNNNKKVDKNAEVANNKKEGVVNNKKEIQNVEQIKDSTAPMMKVFKEAKENRKNKDKNKDLNNNKKTNNKKEDVNNKAQKVEQQNEKGNKDNTNKNNNVNNNKQTEVNKQDKKDVKVDNQQAKDGDKKTAMPMGEVLDTLEKANVKKTAQQKQNNIKQIEKVEAVNNKKEGVENNKKVEAINNDKAQKVEQQNEKKDKTNDNNLDKAVASTFGIPAEKAREISQKNSYKLKNNVNTANNQNVEKEKQNNINIKNDTGKNDKEKNNAGKNNTVNINADKLLKNNNLVKIDTVGDAKKKESIKLVEGNNKKLQNAVVQQNNKTAEKQKDKKLNINNIANVTTTQDKNNAPVYDGANNKTVTKTNLR